MICIHIPKAGGTTLRSVIERQYEPDTVCFADPPAFDFVPLAESIPARKRETIQCFVGHMRFGLHEWLSRPVTYVTMLRSPLDRVLSYYYYVLRERDHPLHEIVRSQRLTIADCFDRALSTELNDGQVRLLCGFAEGPTMPFGAPTHAMLAAAKANLEHHFGVIGICEEFDASLLVLGRRLDWKNLYYRKLNVTRDRPDLGDVGRSARAVIERHNALDLELYEHARTLFHQMTGRHGVSRASVVAFRVDQRRFWTLRALRKRKQRVGEAVRGWAFGSALAKLRRICTRMRVVIICTVLRSAETGGWLP